MQRFLFVCSFVCFLFCLFFVFLFVFLFFVFVFVCFFFKLWATCCGSSWRTVSIIMYLGILFTVHIHVRMRCNIRDKISRLTCRLNRWQSCLIRLLDIRWHDDTSLSLRYIAWLLTTHLIHLPIFPAAMRVALFCFIFDMQVDNVGLDLNTGFLDSLVLLLFVYFRFVWFFVIPSFYK